MKTNNNLPNSAKERIRPKTLLSYDLMDSSPEIELDHLVKLVSLICQTPVALISFLDEKRQWCKANIGLGAIELPRENTFCQYTVMGHEIMEIEDVYEDDLFKNNPNFIFDPNIRFYAGLPLTTKDGQNIGTLCVMDTEPRKLDREQKDSLKLLAQHTMDHLELKKKNIALEKEIKLLSEKDLEGSNIELQYYKMAIDEISSVAITDEKGTIIHVNDKFCEVSKYSREELVGKPQWLIDSAFHDKDFIDHIWQTLTSGNIWKGEIKNRAKDGSIYWEFSIFVPFMNEQGVPYKYIIFKRDITKQKFEENEVEEFFNLSLDFLCIANSKGYFEKVSPTFSLALGYSVEELLSQPILNFVHEEDLAPTLKEFEKLALSQKTISFENRYKCTDGSFKILSWNASPNNEKGVIYATARDVTKNKKIDEENKRLSLVAKNINNIVTILDKNSEIQWVNDSFEKITQYTLEEVQGKSLLEFWKSAVNDKKAKSEIKKTLKSLIPFSGEIVHENKSGNEYWVEVNITPVFNDANEIINFIIIESDITDKKQKDQKILDLIKTQQSIFDGASYGIIFTDADGYISRINKSCLNILGYSEEELIGKENLALFHDKMEVFRRTQDLIIELGEKIKPGLDTLLIKAREKDIVDENEWTYISKEGKKIPVWLSITCLKDEKNHILGYLAEAEDYTLHKEVESELINAKQLAEQAVALKDNFLANMSHEIRTPMNAIIGFTDLLAGSELNKDQREFVDNVKMAGENLMLIINDILDLSKIESGKLLIESCPFDIKSTMKHVYDLLNVKAKEKALDFNLFIDANMPDILVGDKGRINQIIMNLAGNAIKFTKKGEVNMFVKKMEETEETVVVKFSVKDTGIGISKEKLDIIFKRFSQAEESTTRNFGGTGLGLNISQQLIKLQGGELKVRSLMGCGSEFYFSIEFKKSQEQIHIIEEPKVIVPDSLKKLSILLCEDNYINQRLAANVIQNFGFNINIAENGKEGLDLLSKNHYDLILMDLQMPVMDGYQTTTYIRNKLKSDIPIVAMTAHSLIGERKKCIEVGMDDYVTKPFKQEDLLGKIISVTSSKDVKPAASVNYLFLNDKVDLTYLKDLSSGMEDFEREMMELFIPRVKSDMEKLLGAIDEKNYKNLKGIAHGLKSTLSLFMLNESVNFLSQIEAEATDILHGSKKALSSQSIEGSKMLRQKLLTDSKTVHNIIHTDYTIQSS